MARLDSFKNSDVKDITVLNALLENNGLLHQEKKQAPSFAALMDPKKGKEKKEDTPLRNQMLRWYNANPDMLVVAVNNLLRITREAGRAMSLFTYSAELAEVPESLAAQPENYEVTDITLLENFLFINYPVLERLAALTRPESYKPKHLITEDIDKLDVYKLTQALVEESHTSQSMFPYYKYVDLLDITTC